MYDEDASRILRDAEYAALYEIVERGIACGRAIERCEPNAVISALLSVFGAVDAYYMARSAGARNLEVEI